MMNNYPKVSICIPTYNYAFYIASAIESVIAQTYANFELIIIDDCSSDNTGEIVMRYADLDKRIKFYKNDRNLGMVENWNRCLERATGDFLKVMGADDLLEPSCIEKSVNVLIESPHVSLVSCARLLIDKDGHPIRASAYSHKFQIVSGIKVIRKCFFTANLIGEPTAVMFRKKDAARGFDPHYRQLTDLEMWFHLLEQGDFAYIPEILCKFRVHLNQTTKTNIKSLKFIDDEILLFNDHIEKRYLGNSHINRQRWKFKLCYTIWSHKFIGLDINTIRSRIRGYMPLFLFYPLAYSRLLKDKVMEVARSIL